MSRLAARRTSRRVVGALGVAALAGALLAGCSGSSDLVKDYQASAGKGYVSSDGTVTVYSIAQRKSAVTWSGKDTAGATVGSSTLAGKVVLLNFWYAGCAPCRAEAPALVKLAAGYQPKGVAFVGVDKLDDAATADTFASTHGIDYPSVLDAGDNAVQLAFAGAVPANQTPTTVLLDKQGRVAAVFSGLIQSPSIVSSVLDQLLAESGS